jgi:hypothetical protein
MDDLDLERRELCPDGRCVGVIGPDGRCGTCGLARDALQAPPRAEPAETDARSDETDLDARVPCPDETCVGIIGADGRCGTCGRSGLGQLDLPR